jgi:hypothetical protein
VARSCGQAGGWHRTVDARYPVEPSGVSPAQHAGYWCWFSAGAPGHGDLPGHRCRAGYCDRAA